MSGRLNAAKTVYSTADYSDSACGNQVGTKHKSFLIDVASRGTTVRTTITHAVTRSTTEEVRQGLCLS